MNVHAIADPSPADMPPNNAFPLGFFEYTIADAGSGQAAAITVYWAAGVTINSYLKYGVHDIEPGRRLVFTENADVRLFGGFRWASINQSELVTQADKTAGAAFGHNQTIRILNRRKQSKQRRCCVSVDSVTSC